MSVKRTVEVYVPTDVDLLTPTEVKALRDQLAKKNAAIVELVEALGGLRIRAGYALNARGMKGNSRRLEDQIINAKELCEKYKPREEDE